MDKENQLWNEYQNLRDEIRGADSLNYQIIGIVVGAVAAILTTGVSQEEPVARLLIFLCCYVVTIPGYRLLQGNRRRTWKISTYIRVFLEPNLEFINWETRLDNQRKKATSESARQAFSSLIGTNEWFIITLLNLMAGGAAIFYAILQLNVSFIGLPLAYLQIGLAITVIALNSWLIASTAQQERELRRLGKVEQSFLKSWIQLRDEQGQTQNQAAG